MTGDGSLAPEDCLYFYNTNKTAPVGAVLLRCDAGKSVWGYARRLEEQFDKCEQYEKQVILVCTVRLIEDVRLCLQLKEPEQYRKQVVLVHTV